MLIQIDGKINTNSPGGEGVLANFFNSLLNKKTTGSPASPSMGSPRSMNGTTPGSADLQDKNSIRTDAAAELDRITRSVKKDIDFTQTDC